MDKIKVTFYPNLILNIALVMSVIVTFLLGLFCKEFLGGEEGMLVFAALSIMCLLQIPALIYMFIKGSKDRDYIIDGNNIIQKGVILFNRSNIVSIKRLSLLKSEIRYSIDNEEKVIFIYASNKKLENIKQYLMIE